MDVVKKYLRSTSKNEKNAYKYLKAGQYADYEKCFLNGPVECAMITIFAIEGNMDVLQYLTPRQPHMKVLQDDIQLSPDVRKFFKDQ